LVSSYYGVRRLVAAFAPTKKEAATFKILLASPRESGDTSPHSKKRGRNLQKSRRPYHAKAATSRPHSKTRIHITKPAHLRPLSCYNCSPASSL